MIQEHVSAEGFVNYNAIAATGKIDSVIELIATTEPKSLVTTTDMLTFYINSYNALVIKTILDGKSPSNIFSRISFFNGPEYNVAGQSLNLNDLEHKIIRPLNEPRIHFAIACASMSCPPLLNEAYTAGKINEQLDRVTKDFINNEKFNEISATNPKVSMIFKWYEKDYTVNGKKDVIGFINNYVDTKINASATLQYQNYNWDLNEQE